MQQKYLICIAIILGSFIIGLFLYLASVNKPLLVDNSLTLKNNSSDASDIAQTQPAPNKFQCQAEQNTIVTKVIDGDTVVVQGGSHVRLLGMDADEKGYPCYEAAKTRLEELVLNKKILLDKDVTDVDQYNRCLRTIFLGNQNIDAQLVKEGLAVARFYEPDVKYKSEILIVEKQAIENKIGCKWGGAK